ncbi:MAG: tetratricopeptide repeat protein [Burkholderiaceae bacterium]
MKNALVIVTLSLLAASCASLQPAPVAPEPQAAAETAEPVEQQAEAAGSDEDTDEAPEVAQKAEKLPDVALTDEIMVKILAAEIAFQRNDWQFAYITLLGLAQQTRDPRLTQRATEIALAAKRPSEALAAIRLWHELAPDSEQATQYFLGFIVLSDNLEEAQPIFAERLQNADPKARGPMILQIQRTLARARDKQAALPMLEALVTPYLALPEAHLALAQAAFARGDGERAVSEAQQALALKPDSQLAALTLAQVSADKDAAAQALQTFLVRQPKAREVRIAYARLLTEQKQYRQARAEFATLLKSDPKDLSILFALGVLSAQTDDYKAAEGYLTSYIQILGANPDEGRDPTQALLLLSQIAQERKDTDAALKWLAQIEPGPAYIGAQIRRAQLVAARGQLDEARRMLTEIPTEGEREQLQVVQADAQLLRDAGQPQQAYDVLRRALQQFPDNTDLLYDYAMAAEKLDRLDVMERALRRIMQLAPKNQHAYNALGYSLADRNLRLPEALELIQKALQLAPEDPFILDSMGWVQYRLGRLQEAEDYLRRAYALQPDAEIGVHLGEVLWVKGQRDAAQQLWRDARAKDPQNDALRSTLARLQVHL